MIMSLTKPGRMRTTIELSNEHRRALHDLAAHRGVRGYAKLIQEAVDLYIRETAIKESVAKRLLKMQRFSL
jgi:predicted DNA-binding protein